MMENYVTNIKYINTTLDSITLDQQNNCLIILDSSASKIDECKIILDIQNKISNFAIIGSSPAATILTAVSAIKSGAIDYLPWPFSEAELEAVVRNADAQLVSRTLTNEKAGMRARFRLLSPREKKVVEAIIVGKQNKIIANDLGLSIRTVEMYRASLMKKLGAKSVSDIVRAHLFQLSSY